MPLPDPVLDAAALDGFLAREFPQVNRHGRAFTIERVERGLAVMRLHGGEEHLRPGGTVSGPAMMTLADLGAYVVILAHIGPVALAVTTNLSINFLRKPPPGDLLADCRLIKLGRTLAVVECGIRRDGDADLVAHAVLTYSIPPNGAVK